MREDDVEEVKDLFIKSDVINSCKTLANSYYEEAKHVLDELQSSINPSEIEFFEDLLDFVTKRNY